jgi:hypothetical protein
MENIIYHLNIYQGKNAINAHIVEEAWNLPMTQKAVVNVIITSGIDTDLGETIVICISNWYPAPEFVVLHKKYKILSFGSVWTNHKGWNGTIKILKKNPHGTSLVKYDLVNKVFFGQWNDNEVVDLISTLKVLVRFMVKGRVGDESAISR